MSSGRSDRARHRRNNVESAIKLVQAFARDGDPCVILHMDESGNVVVKETHSKFTNWIRDATIRPHIDEIFNDLLSELNNDAGKLTIL